MDSRYSAASDVDFDNKEEVQAMCSSAPPQPREGLNSLKPPPFLTKTYDMVEDPHTDSVVSWSKTNNSFVVWNSHKFSTDLLPKYFKHNNFSSFVRQLNTYGFRKVDPDKWEFANEGFLRGQKHLLKHIQRRRPPLQGQQYQQGMGPCVEVGQFGMDKEIERLRRDKNVLMMEVVRLRQQQQSSKNELQAMGNRIRTTEQRQQQMMTFLARAMCNPTFLSQLVQKNQVKQHLAGAKKRQRLPQGGDSEECKSQISSFQAQAETLPQTKGQRQIVKCRSSYSISPPEPTVPNASLPLEAFLCTLGDENPTEEEDASLEAASHDRAEEGLVSPTDFERLEAQGFEHGSSPFHPSVPQDVAASCSRDTHDDPVRADCEDLDLKTADVFWEELLGEEFDSDEDSEIEMEPSYPPSS